MSELKPTTAADYRKGKTKMAKLASGAVFEIRKMPIPAFSILIRILDIDAPKGTPIEKVEEMMQERMSDPEFKVKVVEAMVKVLPHCVVNPPIRDQPAKDVLTIDDVETADIVELFGVIMDFSGIDKMAKQLREKFRDLPDR